MASFKIAEHVDFLQIKPVSSLLLWTKVLSIGPATSVNTAVI